MGRRNYRRSYQQDGSSEVVDILVGAVAKLPWYIGLLLAAVIYGIAHVVFKMQIVPIASTGFAWMFLFRIILEFFVPFVFFMGGIISAGHAITTHFRRAKMYNSAREQDLDIEIRHMNWRDFEVFTGDWFRAQGYEVTQHGGDKPDGGVDVELRKDGQLYVVQCKHYFAGGKVGVELVRALRGSMSDSNAAGGFFVTTGQYTPDAVSYAQNNFITLINIKDLVARINNQSGTSSPATPESSKDVPLCPACSSAMVRRTAHRGDNAGNEFWGCSRYPECKGIRPVE